MNLPEYTTHDLIDELQKRSCVFALIWCPREKTTGSKMVCGCDPEREFQLVGYLATMQAKAIERTELRLGPGDGVKGGG